VLPYRWSTNTSRIPFSKPTSRTHELLKAARRTSCCFHHISTDKVYGSLAARETFESGIRRTLAWYLERESWRRKVMNGVIASGFDTSMNQLCLSDPDRNTESTPALHSKVIRSTHVRSRLAAGLVLASLARACKMWRMTC
jgi:hypothetical protein